MTKQYNFSDRDSADFTPRGFIPVVRDTTLKLLLIRFVYPLLTVIRSFFLSHTFYRSHRQNFDFSFGAIVAKIILPYGV